MVIYCGMWISLVCLTVCVNCEAEHFFLFVFQCSKQNCVDFPLMQVSLTLYIPWENGYCCCIVTDDATYCMVISPVLEKFSVNWKVLQLNSFLHVDMTVLRCSLRLTELVLSLHSPDIPAQHCYFPVYLQEDRMFFVGKYLTFSCNIHLSLSPLLCAIPLPLCHSCSVNFSFTNIAVRGC